MNKSWIGIGVLGCLLTLYILISSQRIAAIEEQQRDLEQIVHRLQSGHSEPGQTRELTPPVDSIGDNALRSMSTSPPTNPDGTPSQRPPRMESQGTQAVDPDVLRQAIQRERASERKQRDEERVSRVTAHQREITTDLAAQFDWTADQEQHAFEILQDTMQRGMEVRRKMHEGQIERGEARQLRDELRLEMEERLEDVVGVEGMEAVFERIPGRRGR